MAIAGVDLQAKLHDGNYTGVPSSEAVHPQSSNKAQLGSADGQDAWNQANR